MKVVNREKIKWFMGIKENGAPMVYTTPNEIDRFVFEIDDERHNIIHELGDWIKKPCLIGRKYYCSMCGRNYRMPREIYSFCPHCGAVMGYEENH